MCHHLDNNFQNPKIFGKEVKIVTKINQLGFFLLITVWGYFRYFNGEKKFSQKTQLENFAESERTRTFLHAFELQLEKCQNKLEIIKTTSWSWELKFLCDLRSLRFSFIQVNKELIIS